MRALVVSLLMIVSLAAGGCKKAHKTRHQEARPAQPAAAEAATAAPTAAPSGADRNRDRKGFLLSFHPPASASYQPYHDLFSASQRLKDLISFFNKKLDLPREVPILFRECDGKKNAFYSNKNHDISVCYEYIDAVREAIASDPRLSQEVLDSLHNVFTFTLLHEINHALVNELDLPITGKTEDVADEFAAVMVLSKLPKGSDEIARDAALRWRAVAQNKKISASSLTDKHSLPAQRATSIFCYLYGSHPARYKQEIVPQYVPEKRAKSCKKDFRRSRRSWNKILDEVTEPADEEEEGHDARSPAP